MILNFFLDSKHIIIAFDSDSICIFNMETNKKIDSINMKAYINNICLIANQNFYLAGKIQQLYPNIEYSDFIEKID